MAVTTIQKTYKILKLQLLLSTLVLLVGIIAGFDAAFSGSMGSAAVAVLCIVGGIGWRVLVKCLIWWCHE